MISTGFSNGVTPAKSKYIIHRSQLADTLPGRSEFRSSEMVTILRSMLTVCVKFRAASSGAIDMAYSPIGVSDCL